jgi:hypothetical protein
MSYSKLSIEEHVTIQIGQAQGFSLRQMALAKPKVSAFAKWPA